MALSLVLLVSILTCVADGQVGLHPCTKAKRSTKLRSRPARFYGPLPHMVSLPQVKWVAISQPCHMLEHPDWTGPDQEMLQRCAAANLIYSVSSSRAIQPHSKCFNLIECTDVQFGEHRNDKNRDAHKEIWLGCAHDNTSLEEVVHACRAVAAMTWCRPLEETMGKWNYRKPAPAHDAAIDYGEIEPEPYPDSLFGDY